jgi:hypothetical protein
MLSLTGHAEIIAFHHDGFEFNDGSRPAHDFDLERRRLRYGSVDRIVYLERDPRDVMVSLYHQVTGRFRDMFGYRGTLSEFIRDPYFGAENLARFRAMWNVIAEEANVTRISYEGCHEDPPATLARVLSFYGLDVPREEIEAAAGQAGFENMRAVEESASFSEPWLRPRNGFQKVRKGQVGGFADVLDNDDILYLNGIFGLSAPRLATAPPK